MAVCSWGWGAEGNTVEAMSGAWGARFVELLRLLSDNKETILNGRILDGLG